MLEKLLQAAAITLLLSLLAGAKNPKTHQAPIWNLQSLSLLSSPQLRTPPATLMLR